MSQEKKVLKITVRTQNRQILRMINLELPYSTITTLRVLGTSFSSKSLTPSDLFNFNTYLS